MRRMLIGLAVVVALLQGVSARAQEPRSREQRPDSLLVGAEARARARLAEITGRRAADSVSAARQVAADSVRVTTRFVLPALRLVQNSDLANSQNDGALWAGRGANVVVSGGFVSTFRSSQFVVDASVVPVITYSANRPFQVIRGADVARSGFSSPWHSGPESADLPLRFGTDPITAVSLGESAVRLTSHNVRVGAGSATRWWGPGIRNALLLSNNAGPIPQVFIETAAPVRTPIGDFSALLMAGTLTESIYFDLNSVNDYRSLSGLLIQYRPALLPHFTAGVARLVMSPMEDAFPVGNLFQAVTRWDNPSAEPPRSDQLLSVFARWVFPESGFEAYGEWARMQPPRSLREFLLNTHYTQGYTVGAQWAAPAQRGSDRIRIQAEVTYLEQSDVDGKRAPSFYVGRATEHGFTHRGQVIGAAIGPGGSSQWLAADYMTPRWTGGLFVGRIRWENDKMYEQAFPNFYKHDVTIQSGLRGAYHHALGDVGADVTIARRMNYLFQSSFGTVGGFRNVDVQNITFSLGITPR